MVIASLYPIVESQYESSFIFDWGFIRALQRKIGETSHDYHVFLPHGRQPPDPSAIGKNVHIKSTMELSDFFQEFQVDIWHDFGHTQASDLVSLRHLSGQNFPITVKAELPFLANTELATYSALSNKDVLICSRPSTQKLIESVYSCSTSGHTYPQICTIPHGVKPQRFDRNKKKDARYLLHLPEDSTIILCLIDFSQNNSIDILPLIRAFHDIRKKREDVRLIVSGSDGYGSIDRIEKHLEGSALRRQVIFLPDVGESARLLLLAAADIFISPSDSVYTDNGPEVLEAMAKGIPVIATDDENGYIDHGKTGFKVEKGCFPLSYQALRNRFAFIPHHVRSLILSQGVMIDVQQIIKHLLLLIEDVPLRGTMGGAAIQYVSEHHHITKIVEEYENLWSNLCQEGSVRQLQSRVSENRVSDDSWLPLLISSISQTINENTPLHITSDGQTLLETQDVVIYEEMKEVIFAPIVLEILNLSQSVTSLSKITQSFLDLLNPDETKDVVPDIAYHVAWCIKQGLMHPERTKVRDFHLEALDDPDSITERGNL